MKKKKQSKKRWAWTEAQKRKHFPKHRNWYSGPPNWFCKLLEKSDKSKCQKALLELKNGGDPEDFIFNPKYKGSSAKWLWW